MTFNMRIIQINFIVLRDIDQIGCIVIEKVNILERKCFSFEKKLLQLNSVTYFLAEQIIL